MTMQCTKGQGVVDPQWDATNPTMAPIITNLREGFHNLCGGLSDQDVLNAYAWAYYCESGNIVEVTGEILAEMQDAP